MNKSMRSPKPVFFRKDGGWKSVSTDAIVCMEANASKCKFYMADGTELIVEMPLVTALNKTREQNDVFLRIHRSFAVNVEHIDIFYNDSLIMKNEMRVPIGRLYRDILPDNLTIIDKRNRTSDEDGNEQID